MSDETITIEQLNEHGIDVVPEIVWDDIETLRPGVDFHDGVTYVTIPGKVNQTKMVGKGRDRTPVVEAIDALVCVTNEPSQFAYTRERIAEKGFAPPDDFTLVKDRRWSKDSIQRFLREEETRPGPVVLHRALREIYETHIEFKDEIYYDMMPLFILGSYMFRLYQSVGYIHFNGTAGSGKSQNLNILSALALNAIWTSNISAAALYRSLAGNPGVALIDEAEGWDGERGEDLRRILNAGYINGSKVHRTEKGPNDVFVTKGYDTFGPKAIASINELDQVIGSRCIVVAMRPAVRTIPEFKPEDERWARLRDRLYLWTMYHSRDLKDLIVEWNEHTRTVRAPKLIGRQWQITQMYITIADYIDRYDGGDRCNRLIAFFNDYFAALQRAQDATDRTRIVLKCLPRLLATRAPMEDDWYSMKSLHEIVIEQLDTDAAEYFKTRTLGKHLNVLGFKDKRTAKGGTQVRVSADKVREEFRQRRVDPFPEDREWLDGKDFDPIIQHAAGPSEPEDSLWTETDED